MNKDIYTTLLDRLLQKSITKIYSILYKSVVFIQKYSIGIVIFSR